MGTPLVFHYGESTGFYVGENELRVGHEPLGYRVVLSTRKGEFPIRPLLVDGEEKLFSDHAVAVAQAREMASP